MRETLSWKGRTSEAAPGGERGCGIGWPVLVRGGKESGEGFHEGNKEDKQ